MFRKKTAIILAFCLFLQGLGLVGGQIPRAEASYDPALQPALIASGNYHTLFVGDDGTVKASGSDSGTYALGLGSTSYTYSYTYVDSAGVTQTGTATDYRNYPTPTAISGLTNVTQVAAYGYSSYALLNNGRVKSWGQNSSGQLGTGNTSTVTSPKEITGLTNVKQIAAGNGFAIALLNDGTLKGWGTNTYGELAGAIASTSPVDLGISDVRQIAVGDKFVLALMNNGTVTSWGYNNYGQLGNNSTTKSSTPVNVTGLTNVVQVEAGNSFGMALLQDGTVRAWGLNDSGQLGINSSTPTYSNSPVQVSGITNVRFIAAGGASSVAVLNDDSIRVWGKNASYQLGLTDTTNRLLPTPVSLNFKTAHAYIGSNTSNGIFLVDYDHQVYATGYNGNGTLGLGSTTTVKTFTICTTLQVPSFALIMDINASVVNYILIAATISGPVGTRLVVQYYLDDESEPREQQSQILADGTVTINFQPIVKSTLSRGSHNIRVVANNAYQIVEKTTTFTLADDSYPMTITPSNNSITAFTDPVDKNSQLASGPYRFTIGTQSSDWLASTATLNNSVSSPALDMPGTGNKKLIRLSNGWWVVSGYSGSAATGIVFMVSKDQGQSWQQLCTLVDPDNVISSPAIASSGNNVIGLVRYGSTGIRAFTIDVTSQANENIYDKTTNVDSAQTDIPTVNSVGLTADGSGNVYATWISKNSTYANSYNLRYAKSSDYGLTWSAVTQISTANSTTYAYTNPSIVLINNSPSIFSEYTYGSNYYLYNYSYTGSAWRLTTPVAVGTYPQQNYSVYVDGSTVYLAWSGTDSTDKTAKNIRLVTSTNGGTSWGTALKLTAGNTYSQQLPVITKDTQNKLYIVYSGIDSAISATSYNLRMITSTDGTTWSTPKTLTSFTSGNADQPIVLQDTWQNYSDDNLVVIYKDTLNNQTAIRGTNESGASFTASGLTPNTKYVVTFDVKDATGTIRTTTKTTYTLAEQPVIALTQTGKAPTLIVTDSNPSTTKYQVANGTKYLTTEGLWSNQQVSLALPNKQLALAKLDPKKTYNLKVRAVNEEGVPTNWSATVHVGPPLALPAAPKNIKVQPTSNQVTISWSPVTNATSYDIEIDGQAALVNNGRSLSYVSTGLTPNTLHQYRVRTVQDGTVGAWSTPINVRTLMVAPVIPTQIVATTTAKTATLSWGAVKDALAYEVEWDGQVISTGKSETFHQEGLPVASRHAYRIRAINAGGESPWSPLEIVSTLANVPGAPTFSAPHAGNDSVTLTWTALPDALTYDIEADGVVMSFGDSKTATFMGLTLKSHHQYRVRAVNELGAGDWSSLMDVTTHLLSTPSVISEQLSDQSISFAWSTVPDAASYDVEVDGASVNVSSASYSQTGLAPETTHTYRIRAVNDDGDSAWTDAFTYSTLPQKPNMPSSLSATATKDEVFVVWSPVDNVVGYDVEIDGKVVVDNFTDTSYTDILLSPFSNHTYRVRARTDAIEGDWSPLVSVKTMPDVPSAPSGIAATSAGNIVTLHWNADPTVTKYEVEVDGQVMDAGTKPEYKHRRVVAGTEHKYRIRTINVSGTSPWSGYIINNTITAKLTKGSTVDVGLAGVDVMDFSRYTLQVTYDPNAIDITDLSELTAQKELTVGRIAGTDITVTSFSPGLITFTTDKVISIDESWTGVINSIQMKAKVSGGSSLTYSVIENTETTTR